MMVPNCVKIILTALIMLTGLPVMAQDIGRYSKQEIDSLAKAASFKDADFPFYSRVNGCGPDGWKNKLIPDRSHFFVGPEFTAACDNHDRGYMTLGANRDSVDKQFRSALNAAVDAYLMQTVTSTTDRVVKRFDVQRRSRQIMRRVSQRVKDSLDPRKWKNVIRSVPETIWEDVKVEVTETIKDVRLVTRLSTLDPAAIANMKLHAETFYQAVHLAGGQYYEGSQKEQARYLAWLSDYVQKNP